MAQFVNTLREKEIELDRTDENLIESGMGAIGGLLLGAATSLLPGGAPIGVSMMSGALSGAIPGLLKEGYDQYSPQTQTVQSQSYVGQGLAQMSPAQMMPQLQQMAQYAKTEQPTPWTPGYMNQMSRYA